MARRAQQGAVARCPYCEASLPQVAAECPSCRFPLTMAAADFGFRAPDRSGTTSTATPGGRTAPPVLPGSHGRPGRSRVHGSRIHNIRMAAWLLGLTSVLLLLAGLGALFTATSPEANSDRQATSSLITVLHRATDDPNHRRDVNIITALPDDASDGPFKVSVERSGDFWYGASKSTSGSCFLLVGKLVDGTPVVRGTLDKKDPCTGAEVRRRSEAKLNKSGD